VFGVAAASNGTSLWGAVHAAKADIISAGGGPTTLALPPSAIVAEESCVDGEDRPLYPNGLTTYAGLDLVAVPTMAAAEGLVYDRTGTYLVVAQDFKVTPSRDYAPRPTSATRSRCAPRVSSRWRCRSRPPASGSCRSRWRRPASSPRGSAACRHDHGTPHCHDFGMADETSPADDPLVRIREERERLEARRRDLHPEIGRLRGLVRASHDRLEEALGTHDQTRIEGARALIAQKEAHLNLHLRDEDEVMRALEFLANEELTRESIATAKAATKAAWATCVVAVVALVGTAVVTIIAAFIERG